MIQGVVPDDLKPVRVVSLFKKSDKTVVGYYQQVSILMTISQVFERVAYVQIESYLDQKKLLYNFRQVLEVEILQALV